MKKTGDSELRDLLWRSNLSKTEEARVKELLADQPEASLEAMEESRLNELLNVLPDAPLASNFTSRVMRAVAVENLQTSRKRERPAWRVGFGWVSRLAMAGCLIFAGLFIQKHQSAQREELAASVASLSKVGTMPVGWLEDFDTIKNLSSATPVDDDLLAALR